jgi:nitrate reductase delta subunit
MQAAKNLSPKNCKSFKAIGLLLCYPTQDLQQAAHALADVITDEALLKQKDIKQIRSFAEHIANSDLYELQENFVDSFDRVRSLSLHLFEHVHGDSRDRGQAMVDLSNLYLEHGFTIDANELPDYLPAFLEFLSFIDKSEAIEILQDPLHIITALSKRLAERGSKYHILLNGIIRLLGKEPEKVMQKIAKKQQPDYAELDREWEEQPIEFLGADSPSKSGCGSGGCSSGGCGSIKEHKDHSEVRI